MNRDGFIDGLGLGIIICAIIFGISLAYVVNKFNSWESEGFSIECNVKLEPKLIMTKQGVSSDTLYVYENK